MAKINVNCGETGLYLPELPHLRHVQHHVRECPLHLTSRDTDMIPANERESDSDRSAANIGSDWNKYMDKPYESAVANKYKSDGMEPTSLVMTLEPRMRAEASVRILGS